MGSGKKSAGCQQSTSPVLLGEYLICKSNLLLKIRRWLTAASQETSGLHDAGFEEEGMPPARWPDRSLQEVTKGPGDEVIWQDNGSWLHASHWVMLWPWVRRFTTGVLLLHLWDGSDKARAVGTSRQITSRKPFELLGNSTQDMIRRRPTPLACPLPPGLIWAGFGLTWSWGGEGSISIPPPGVTQLPPCDPPRSSQPPPLPPPSTQSPLSLRPARSCSRQTPPEPEVPPAPKACGSPGPVTSLGDNVRESRQWRLSQPLWYLMDSVWRALKSSSHLILSYHLLSCSYC